MYNNIIPNTYKYLSHYSQKQGNKQRRKHQQSQKENVDGEENEIPKQTKERQPNQGRIISQAQRRKEKIEEGNPSRD